MKAPIPVFGYNRDTLAEYAACQKTTVDLAEEWKNEIKTMNKQMEAWHDAIVLGQQRSLQKS